MNQNINLQNTILYKQFCSEQLDFELNSDSQH